MNHEIFVVLRFKHVHGEVFTNVEPQSWNHELN